MPSRLREGSSTSAAVAEKVQAILASKGLTLYRASQQSVALYGRSSPYFLPHNLYYDLRAGSFRPSIHQISALSRISGYRVADWLRVFGYNLEDITRLQVLLPSKRTIAPRYLAHRPERMDPLARQPARSEFPCHRSHRSRKLLRGGPCASRSGRSGSQRSTVFIYAKVGREDAFAFPDLAPGSIVRVNPDLVDDTATERTLRFLIVSFSLSTARASVVVAYASWATVSSCPSTMGSLMRRLSCIVLKRQGSGALSISSSEPLLRAEEPEVPKDLARHWKPQPLPSHEDFGQLLKRTRRRRNLSVREAARMSRTIAEVLKDDRYTTSPSSLSDYELSTSPPRDFHKIITLCSVYGLAV